MSNANAIKFSVDLFDLLTNEQKTLVVAYMEGMKAATRIAQEEKKEA